MKQTVEEAAWQELMSSYAIVVKGEFAYQQQAMLNMFRKGVEWQAKQSPWISVEDAIPNKQAKGMCQVKFVDGSICLLYTSGKLLPVPRWNVGIVGPIFG